MNTENKVSLYNVFALVCAIWLFATGWMWTYYINIVFSFPIGILGYFLWKRGKQKDPQSILNKMALSFLIGGSVTSIIALFLFL